jgi:phage-related protein
MTSKGSSTRIKWEGDTQREIRSWPDEVRQDLGLELNRLDHFEEPLNARRMGKVLPGVSELRTEDADFWYRVMYWLNSGWIYVLNCFKKKTNKTSPGDIALAKQRMVAVKERQDAPAPARREGKESEKSA